MDGCGQLVAVRIHRVFGDALLLIRDAVAVGPEKQHRIGIRHRLRTVGCDCRLRGAAGDHDRAVRELVLDHVHQPRASRGLRPIRMRGEHMHDIPLRAVGHLAVIRSHESTRILT